MRSIYLAIIFALLISNATAYQDMEYTVQNGTNSQEIAQYYATEYNMSIYGLHISNNSMLCSPTNCIWHYINAKIINNKEYFFEFNSQHGTTIINSIHNTSVWYYKTYDNISKSTGTQIHKFS